MLSIFPKDNGLALRYHNQIVEKENEMAKKKLDKETRKAIRDARKMMEEVAKADGNEAETRRRVERFFSSLMGYDVFKHISREYAVGGGGITEYCDFAIQIESGEAAQPVIMVELKKVNIDLSPKHLKQVTTYAINKGCDWLILTNGCDWQLHHVSFGKPPRTKMIVSWNLLHDDPVVVAEKFDLIGYRNVKRGGLDKLWQKANVLTTRNVLGAILSDDSLKSIRRELRKATDVFVTPEEIVGAIRRILNDSALTEMENIKITLPQKTKQKKKKIAKTDQDAPKQITSLETVSSVDIEHVNREEKPDEQSEFIPPVET